MRPIWARRRDPAAFHLGTPEIGTARDSGFAADSSLERSGFELPVPGHGKLCQTSILFVLSQGGRMLHPALSLFARRDIAPNRGRLWADLTAPLEAAPR